MLRPDILFIEGLVLSDAPTDTNASLPRDRLRRIQQTCTVHIIELGYTSEASHAETLQRKRQQHLQLLIHLTAAGWSVSTGNLQNEYVHIILLGTTGTIFKSTDILHTLDVLGIQKSRVPTLLRALNVHAVTSFDSIICSRRRIEWAPNYNHASPILLHDPP
jgi:hypothetical protein